MGLSAESDKNRKNMNHQKRSFRVGGTSGEPNAAETDLERATGKKILDSLQYRSKNEEMVFLLLRKSIIPFRVCTRRRGFRLPRSSAISRQQISSKQQVLARMAMHVCDAFWLTYLLFPNLQNLLQQISETKRTFYLIQHHLSLQIAQLFF